MTSENPRHEGTKTFGDDRELESPIKALGDDRKLGFPIKAFGNDRELGSPTRTFGDDSNFLNVFVFFILFQYPPDNDRNLTHRSI